MNEIEVNRFEVAQLKAECARLREIECYAKALAHECRALRSSDQIRTLTGLGDLLGALGMERFGGC